MKLLWILYEMKRCLYDFVNINLNNKMKIFIDLKKYEYNFLFKKVKMKEEKWIIIRLF